MRVERHFVTFYSPGTFVAEETTKEIDAWDVETAMQMADGITERYGATPYGFQFLTRTRGDDDLDSKVSERSGTYFLGGRVLTLEQLKALNSDKDRILISNMECNGWHRVVQNDNSWRWTMPFRDNDTVLDYTPRQPQGDGE